ncbi:hypothetical protein AB3N59_07625 [Leptospira sp. WS92.C1]
MVLAFFKTFAIHSIAEILDKTKQFENFGQIDMSISSWGIFGKPSRFSQRKAAMKQLDPIHNEYTISNEDFLYTLRTFIYEPVRWNVRFGWRKEPSTKN